MNSSAPGRGGHWSGYQRLDNQAASASRWSHRVKRLPSGRGRRLANDEVCYEPRPSQRSVTSHQSFDSLVNSERFRVLKELSDPFGKHYDGRKHGKFATDIKEYTTSCQRSLNLYEQTRLMPWLAAFQPPTHWNWRSLTTVFHSLTAAGAFTSRPFADQAVTDAQAAFLTGFLDAVRHKCGENPRCLDVRAIASLLWVMVKLMDNGCSLTPELQETVIVLLPHVVALKEQFIPQHISTILWAVAKLVDNSQELITEFKELLVVLLPRVHALNDQFNAWGIANLLWATAKLLDNGQELTPEFKEAVATLLPRVTVLKERFIAQAAANLLWALAKLVDNGHELTAALTKAVAALLSRVHALQARFDPQNIANMLWAMAKLVDHGQELCPQCKEAVAVLLAQVRAQKGQFITQGIANLIWAMAKLVEKGQQLTPELKEVLIVLLPHVIVEKDQFIPQHIANLLWAMAKLVDSEQTLIRQFDQAVAVLLPRVQALKADFKPLEVNNLLWAMAKLVSNDHDRIARFSEPFAALLPRVRALTTQFSSREVSNLLWSVAKLVDSGQALTPELKETVAALLPRVNALKEQFTLQGIVNLLWTVAKLVDNGHERTPVLNETIATLLSRISTLKDQFVPQHIASLLWAVAKLVDNGQELTPEYKRALATLLPRVSVLKGQFNSWDIASLLWTMGSLGDFVSTEATVSVAESLLCQSEKFLLFTRQELIMSLWGLLVCCARLYLDNSDQYDTFECLINKLFSLMENGFIDNEHSKSVMAMAASWLGRACPVNPHYQTANSVTQSVFQAQLQSALPSLQIEQEKSVHFLPPVDLLLPEQHIAIEIQGPLHYVGRDFQTRNGSTLLKTALLRKAGYDVLEIPVNHLSHSDSAKTYIGQIQRKMMNISVNDDVHHVDVSCTDRGGEFFSA